MKFMTYEFEITNLDYTVDTLRLPYEYDLEQYIV